MSVTIMVPKYGVKSLIVPEKIIKCNPDEFILRCGNCGHTNFGVVVKIVDIDKKEARVSTLVCMENGCFKLRNIDHAGIIEGDGAIEIRSNPGQLITKEDSFVETKSVTL